LQRHGCHIDFSKSVMVMGHKELTCVDKLGRPRARGIQVVQSCTIPGRSRATVHCKVDGGYSSGLGVVESTHGRIRPAHSLNRLTRQGEIWVQYVNPFPASVNLPSSSVLGQFHPVPEEDSGTPRETTAESPQHSRSTGRRATPHHAETRDRHWAQGVGNQERRGKARLLHQHSETPHQGDRGDSLNRDARREVPTVAGTARTQPGQGFPAVQAGQTGLSGGWARPDTKSTPKAGCHAPGVSASLPRRTRLDWRPHGATTPPRELSGGGS